MAFLFRLAIFLMVPLTLLGLDVKYCSIGDPEKHAHNQQLLKVIIEKELSAQEAKDQAHYLSANITKIASSLINQGFSAEAYVLPSPNPHSLLSFNCFALWEGKNNPSGEIPLSFFVYIWPSETAALKYNATSPQNHYYRSTIHCHPIPCAFAVLKGSLIQRNYACVNPMEKTVHLIDDETFRKGEGDVDDLTESRIHQLYTKDCDSGLCLSLHAYGLSSEEQVMKCFKDTLSDCTYNPEG